MDEERRGGEEVEENEKIPLSSSLSFFFHTSDNGDRNHPLNVDVTGLGEVHHQPPHRHGSTQITCNRTVSHEVTYGESKSIYLLLSPSLDLFFSPPLCLFFFSPSLSFLLFLFFLQVRREVGRDTGITAIRLNTVGMRRDRVSKHERADCRRLVSLLIFISFYFLHYIYISCISIYYIYIYIFICLLYLIYINIYCFSYL